MPPTVFISYSHEDEAWKDRLLKHLAVLKQQGEVEVWDDRKIRGGDEWPAEIWKAMDAAQVAVLLVSANSLASEFILEKEVPYLLERRKRDGIFIFPVLCTDCLWGHFPWLSGLQMFPRDGKALGTCQAL
jgi:TIR domain